MDLAYFNSRKEKAHEVYTKKRSIFCPYLNSEIILNSDGFHHLQFSDRRERSKEEQILKFNLLPLAIEVIKKSGTLQEYRKLPQSFWHKSKDGFSTTKIVQYWGFSAIVGDKKIKIRAIVRKAGEGNFVFWSVMPDSKIKGGQRLFYTGIQDD